MKKSGFIASIAGGVIALASLGGVGVYAATGGFEPEPAPIVQVVDTVEPEAEPTSEPTVEPAVVAPEPVVVEPAPAPPPPAQPAHGSYPAGHAVPNIADGSEFGRWDTTACASSSASTDAGGTVRCD